MRPKSIVLLIVALGCGLVSALGINRVIALQKSTPAATPGETELIYVTMTEVGMNDMILPAMIKLEPWPKDKIPAGAITKLEDVTNRRTRVRMFSGEPLLDAKLLPKGEQLGSVGVQIPKGFRVVSVRVDEVSSTGSMLLPGDRVDVVVHLPQNSAPSITQSMTRTFLKDVKVFAVNDTVDREHGEGEGKITARTVSLLVKPDQAQKVTLADQLGKIRLVMRNPEDEDEETVDDGTDVSDLTGVPVESPRDDESPPPPLLATLPAFQPTPPAPAADPQPQPQPQQAPGFKVVVIRGNEVEELILDPDSSVARHNDGVAPLDASAAPVEHPNTLRPDAEKATDENGTDATNTDDSDPHEKNGEQGA